jgi:beta-lactamase class A
MTEHAHQGLETRLTDALQAAGCDGCLYALDIDSGAQVGLHPHRLVVAASVFKVAVALELYRQAAVEGLDLTQQICSDVDQRTIGATGLSNAQDPASLSLRDLASLMLSVSDNAATDAVLGRVGLEKVNATLQALGLRDTIVVNNMRDLIASIVQDTSVPSWEALWSLTAQEHDERLEHCRALLPETATRTTPYDMTRLLRSIWRDEAAPAEACAQVRRLMGQQASYRIAVGFPNDVRVHAKSGSLMGKIRNEIGVVTYPDGHRYALAVFTTAHKRLTRQPAIDQVIGEVAAMAVQEIRGM